MKDEIEYKVKVRFIFEGVVTVKARTPREAQKIVDESFGLVAGTGFHSNLPGDEIDWDFPTHPHKLVDSVSNIS